MRLFSLPNANTLANVSQAWYNGFTVKDFLLQKASEHGIALSSAQADAMLKYMRLTLEVNKSFNLTAITDEVDFIIKHLIDSLTAAYLIEKGAAVVDIGSGAGCPAIPLKILRPDLNITMVEARGKKARFLDEAVTSLALKNIRVINRRIEALGLRGFDCATARACARLSVLVKYAMPCLKTGGKLIAYKGDAKDELSEVQNAVEAASFMLDAQYKRTLVVVEKGV
jgi:16S rRNA (guanine527-N7)-methyltransferase